VVLGLKGTSISVQNLSFARPLFKKPSPPLFSVIGSGKRHQDNLPASLFAVFRTSILIYLPKNKVRAGGLFVTQNSYKKSL
jgi:hypothetical protein